MSKHIRSPGITDRATSSGERLGGDDEAPDRQHAPREGGQRAVDVRRSPPRARRRRRSTPRVVWTRYPPTASLDAHRRACGRGRSAPAARAARDERGVELRRLDRRRCARSSKPGGVRVGADLRRRASTRSRNAHRLAQSPPTRVPPRAAPDLARMVGEEQPAALAPVAVDRLARRPGRARTRTRRACRRSMRPTERRRDGAPARPVRA